MNTTLLVYARAVQKKIKLTLVLSASYGMGYIR
jgi:hypothetical protein